MKRSAVTWGKWDFHTRSDHPSADPRCLPLAVMGIALSQVCCCSLRALYQIILIYSSPEELGVCLWQWEGKERMNRCWVSTPGQDQGHLPQQSPVLCPSEQSQLQVFPADPPLLGSTATKATGPCQKHLNRVLLPQFQMTLCVRDCLHSGSVPQIAPCKPRPWSGLLTPVVTKRTSTTVIICIVRRACECGWLPAPAATHLIYLI